jgi:hypothetical protein
LLPSRKPILKRQQSAGLRRNPTDGQPPSTTKECFPLVEPSLQTHRPFIRCLPVRFPRSELKGSANTGSSSREDNYVNNQLSCCATPSKRRANIESTVAVSRDGASTGRLLGQRCLGQIRSRGGFSTIELPTITTILRNAMRASNYTSCYQYFYALEYRLPIVPRPPRPSDPHRHRSYDEYTQTISPEKVLPSGDASKGQG